MEELLNKLFENGWKPFYEEIKSKWGFRGNYPCEGAIKIRKNTIFISYRYESSNEQTVKWKKLQHSLRELVSKESGLWQFVCEDGMIKHEVYEDIQSWEHTTADHSDFWYTSGDNYEYRVIESALKDESELEQFLLENIKIS